MMKERSIFRGITSIGILGLLLGVILLVFACPRPEKKEVGTGAAPQTTAQPPIAGPEAPPAGEAPKEFRIWSPQFADMGMMQAKYTADGENVNPPLSIEGVPPTAKSLALVMDDPDAPGGTWVHWVVFNIPPGTKEIGENSVPAGATVGRNSWGKNEYGGPAPPSGVHRYVFKLYALDTTLHLEPTATKADLEKAMEGHIVAETSFTGKYTREK